MDVREVDLRQTENKNNNLQTTKQKTTTTKKTQKHKKKCKSFTTMISRQDTALTDFTSNLKGYLSHKCNVLLHKIKV